MTSDNSRHRLGLLAVTALSLFGALFARLWFLQVVEGDTLSLQAEANATREVIIPAPRGRILDRNGVVLVDNRESIVLGIEANRFDELEKDAQTTLLEDLADALAYATPRAERLSVADIRKKLNDSRYSRLRPIPIVEDITPETEIFFVEQAERFPTVVVEHTTVRAYPYGSLAAHLLGYVGALSDEQWTRLEKDNLEDKPYVQTDEIGKAGVEASYEEYLRGTPGRQVFEVDRAGRVVGELASERVEPRAGDDLYLSIDARVQYKAEEALQARLSLAFDGPDGEEAGALTVIDPTTGQVRAMASYPTYDPSALVGGISNEEWANLQGQTLDDQGEPVRDEDGEIVAGPSKLLNRVIQGSYPPASTFKLASSYAGLKLGIITPEDSIADGGSYRLCDGDGPGCLKRNAGGTPHGYVNLSQALTVSSDVYFYRLGDLSWRQREELGDDGMQQHIRELGYGSQTGIDLPGESAGQVPDPASEAALAQRLFEADPGYYDNDPAVAEDAGRWRTGFSADQAIGQKVNATPLQTAVAYAALANGGDVLQPTVIEKITAAGNPDDVHLLPKRSVVRTVDFGAARDSYLSGFRGVVDPSVGSGLGTAVSTFSGFPFSSMPLAGKTGTAQTGEDELGNARPDNSLFVAFTLGGPTQWTASAMLEYSGFGGGAAAPAVRAVLEPIADGTLYQFIVPKGGEIDLEAAAAEASAIGTAGSD